MKTQLSPADLAASVIAVPPLAANADFSVNENANRDLVAHIEAGGVATLLYGGNANVQNWPVSRYAEWVDIIAEAAAQDTWVIPSVGPDWGKMVDQAAILATRRFPAAMLLPMAGPRTEEGLVKGIRDFVQKSGVQAIVYIKSDHYISPESLAILVAEGSIFSVKYAIPRADTAIDPVLSDYIAAIGTERIVSGFGEPPALPHMAKFALSGFTAGCVCIAPTLSQSFLNALKAGDVARAEKILEVFGPLEALRGEGDPIRVLHTAVTLSGVADMGPTLPLLSQADERLWPQIGVAAKELLAAEMAARAGNDIAA